MEQNLSCQIIRMQAMNMEKVPFLPLPIRCLMSPAMEPVANDNISDEPAIRAAIAAAEANDSGIVFFPPGVFRVNTDTDDPTSSIRIRKSNIVLRGSGINATQILMENKMTPTNPNANGSKGGDRKFTIDQVAYIDHDPFQTSRKAQV